MSHFGLLHEPDPVLALARTGRRIAADQSAGLHIRPRVEVPLPHGPAASFAVQTELQVGPIPLEGSGGLAFLSELDRHHGTLQVLVLLHREASASKSRMRQRLKPAQKALESSLDTLVRLHLVEYDTSPRFPFSKRYRLTPQGRLLVSTPLAGW